MQNAPHSGHRERIRSRYADQGSDGFLDHQFLELLLTYALPRRDTNELAHALLDRFGSLENVLNAEIPQLMMVDGVGQGTAVFLRMQGDLNRRIALSRLEDGRGRVQLSSPLLAARFALAKLSGHSYEMVLVVCLNSRREVVHTEQLQRGTVAEAPIYPRSIAEIALLRRAHGIMLMHNHPSGSPAPSEEDVETTTAIRLALESIGVPLLDHLIVAGSFVYSFASGVLMDLSGDAPVSLSLEELAEYQSHQEESLHRLAEPYPELAFITPA